jgi:hypothetical protein
LAHLDDPKIHSGSSKAKSSSSVSGVSSTFRVAPSIRVPVAATSNENHNASFTCVLPFKGALAHLRLYDGTQLVSEQPVTAGMDAWQHANAWKTALAQTLNRKHA